MLSSQLKEKVEDYEKLEVEVDQKLKEQEQKLEEVNSTKIQLEDANRIEEVVKIWQNAKEENCERLEEDISSLRNEVDKLNKNLKISSLLEDILSSQRSLYDKTCLGYVGETSYKKYASLKLPKI